MMTTGLVRVTIAAPQRRIDIALPERSPVAEILPSLLRHAGEGLADDGVTDGGWVLRRSDGTAIEGGRTLGAHRVLDGDVLHLVPRRTQWPELEYDDLVDAIANGAARTGRLWNPQHTRTAGLTAASVAAMLGLVATLRAGPAWFSVGLVTIGVALLFIGAGTAMARAFGDAGGGATLATLGLPYAFFGGAMLLGGNLPLVAFGAPHMLTGCGALLLASVLSYLGVVDRAAVFTAGATLGLFGVLAAWTATADVIGGPGACAIYAGATLIFSPLFGPLAMRLGRLPMPVLPRTAADLVRDDPQPPRHAVYAAVLRSDALLTGMIAGAAAFTVVAEMVLTAYLGVTGYVSVIILLAVLSAGFAIRARLYPALRQRTWLLGLGGFGLVCLAFGPLMAEHRLLLSVALPAVLVLAVIAMAVGLAHSRHQPNAYFGRYAEILEVVLVLATAPVVCAVLDLYSLLRGLGG